MATLKDISVRLKSVRNIQKITASMKMVSAAKFARAQRDLRPAKPYGKGASAEIGKEEDPAPPSLIVAITSDKGLCGAAHSSIAKAIKLELNKSENKNTKLILIGDKARAILSRTYKDHFLLSFNDVGRKPSTFADASIIAQHIMDCGVEFESASMYYNVFKSAIKYVTTLQPLHSLDKVSQSEKVANYDDVDEETLRCYNEFLMTSLVYYAMKESAASEQSARMTAMESATKNAGEMIEKLQMSFNRTRQAAITRELTEIISGAAAV